MQKNWIQTSVLINFPLLKEGLPSSDVPIINYSLEVN